MESERRKKIKVLPNGPYEVSGKVPLNQLRYVDDRNGASTRYKKIRDIDVPETYHLCRCGRSNNKPFCDGSHKQGFDGTETASHKPYDEMAEKIEGKYVDILDAEELCAIARFCDTHGSTWNLVTDSDDPNCVDIVRQQCSNCPSGRLTAVLKDGERIEPYLPQEISILEDTPAEAHGPIWVKGGIPIEDAEGLFYPVRNRVALCRCGKSSNKPFCDGSHMRNQGELRE